MPVAETKQGAQVLWLCAGHFPGHACKLLWFNFVATFTQFLLLDGWEASTHLRTGTAGQWVLSAKHEEADG